jgi:hypothetical protein
LTFKEYIENLSRTDKIKLWDTAMRKVRDTGKEPLEIWLEMAVELHEKFESNKTKMIKAEIKKG